MKFYLCVLRCQIDESMRKCRLNFLLLCMGVESCDHYPKKGTEDPLAENTQQTVAVFLFFFCLRRGDDISLMKRGCRNSDKNLRISSEIPLLSGTRRRLGDDSRTRGK